jgi:hypothetical protein
MKRSRAMKRRRGGSGVIAAARSVQLRGCVLALLCVSVLRSPAVHAHSASDAYMDLTVRTHGADGPIVVQGQWDIALRDLDFVLRLDDDGDGRLTWGEVRRHQAAIERYAYASLHFDGGPVDGGPGTACTVKRGRQMIDEHADGAYVALFFDVVCAPSAHKLALDYRLFFPIDPSHRGILVVHDGADIATAVLSPGNARIELIR